MSIFIKNRNGIEYLYLLAGKSQCFLGRKDDLENLNVQNIYKAVKIVDKNFDKLLAKYIKDMQEHAKYIPKDQRDKYVFDRINSINIILRRIQKR